MMFDLFPIILLMLPGFAFASPAQPVSSLGLTTSASLTANPIGPEPIDPRFSLVVRPQMQPLVEDDCLVAAVQALGVWGSYPLQYEAPGLNYYDADFPRVEIESRSADTSGRLHAQFLVWGMYLGLKRMIRTHRYESVKLLLQWEGRIVGQIWIRPRQGQVPLSLPGEMSFNSTNTLQERSSLNSFNLSASETPGRTSFNFSVPPTPSNAPTEFTMAVNSMERPLPKYNFIMAILDGILASSSLTPEDPLQESVRVRIPPPFGAKFLLVPTPEASEESYMTKNILALALRQIPKVLLLRQPGWVEARILIFVNNIQVAQGIFANI